MINKIKKINEKLLTKYYYSDEVKYSSLPVAFHDKENDIVWFGGNYLVGVPKKYLCLDIERIIKDSNINEDTLAELNKFIANIDKGDRVVNIVTNKNKVKCYTKDYSVNVDHQQLEDMIFTIDEANEVNICKDLEAVYVKDILTNIIYIIRCSMQIKPIIRYNI